ncbi:DUF2510 domain-containing protein [Geodermatophilus sp. FMUSA9-8]|uniref:DUF2510 domain-containing protein n=1 Tax=Geodermatophilus sp. FMUSA9-8 TaxID=3120155 RepID=UPI003009CA88
MTGPGLTTAPAGWYPDPDGAPGMVRWWNGESWSDVTTPAGPGVAVQTPPVAPAPRPQAGWGAGQWDDVPPPPARRPRTAWWVAGSVLAVVAVVVVALVVGLSGGGGGRAVADDPPVPAGPSGTEFPPGTVRIVDEEAGISYPFLGNGWFEYDLGDMAETRTIAGQYFTTQEGSPPGASSSPSAPRAPSPTATAGPARAASRPRSRRWPTASGPCTTRTRTSARSCATRPSPSTAATPT